ncbi:hypothetical protein EV356DRAFT_507187 [Viridothelium virens]|uniref:Uncharacterized protein n=1 Tax=Viridothelium virens TaxID=1048519 RepID=A0A6A6GZJ3_VIRVR|nr:hypothetical protein EV356DRAFT_507187 [Viridothelium virens]
MACRRELEDARRASTSRDILINQEQQTVLHLKGDVDQLKSQLVEKDQRLHGLEDQVQHLQEQSLNHTSQRYEDSDKMSDWSMNAAGGSSSSQHSIAGDEEEDGEGEGEGEEEEEEGEDGEEEKTDELLDHPSVHDANSDKHAQRGPYYQSNPQSEESSAGLDDEEIDEFLASLSGGEEEKSVYALVEEESTLLMLPDEHLSRVEQVEQLRRMDSEVVTVALAHAFTAKTFNNIWNLRKWPLIKSNRWTLNRRLMLDAVEAVKRSPEFNNVLKWLPQPDSRCSRERKLQMLDAIMPSWDGW